MTKKARIPDVVTPDPAMVRRMQWKTRLRISDARCRKDTGYSLLELLAEIHLDDARRRKKARKRPGRFSRQKLEQTATG